MIIQKAHIKCAFYINKVCFVQNIIKPKNHSIWMKSAKKPVCEG